MKKVFLSIIMVVIILTLTACGPASLGEVLRSGKERVTSPDVPDTDLELLVVGNSSFALSLYQALKGEEGNLFYSPYSISLALAMTYAAPVVRQPCRWRMPWTLFS